MKLDGRQAVWLVIERRQCDNEGCRRLHSILPDKLVPYKHYCSDLISAVLDGDIVPEDDMNEDHPCDETRRRWNHWFMENLLRIEGHCHHALSFLKNTAPTDTAILETVRRSCDRWLPAVLRMVYNPGGFLVSV